MVMGQSLGFGPSCVGSSFRFTGESRTSLFYPDLSQETPCGHFRSYQAERNQADNQSGTLPSASLQAMTKEDLPRRTALLWALFCFGELELQR